MSISSALSNAYSGLSAVSRTAEVISNNVSNALTDGYSKREVAVSSNTLGGHGGGVKIDNVSRRIDPVGTDARRRVESSLEGLSVRSKAMQRLSSTLGMPGDPMALASKFSNFENSILAAAASPNSTALLNGIVSDAKSLQQSFFRSASEASLVRLDADASIANQIAVVNQSLKEIEALNTKINLFANSGKSTAGFEDQRQVFVDVISGIIPIRQTTSSSGGVSLFTLGGSILINDTARQLEFSPVSLITPDMTLASGALSGVSIDGRDLMFGLVNGIADGSLAATLRVRDVDAPRFQTQIDGLARDLIERFQNSSVDPSLTPGAPGLFTDNGGAFIPTNEVGLAGRISLNASVDPTSGGHLWRLREGVDASVPGDVGNSAQLLRFSGALNSPKAAGIGMEVLSSADSNGFAEEITSFWALESNRLQAAAANTNAQFTILRSSELGATAVDMDEEIQALLVVEQAYAANARMISVVDGLLKTLLEI